MKCMDYCTEPKRDKFHDYREWVRPKCASITDMNLEFDRMETDYIHAERSSFFFLGCQMMAENEAESAFFNFMNRLCIEYVY